MPSAQLLGAARAAVSGLSRIRLASAGSAKASLQKAAPRAALWFMQCCSQPALTTWNRWYAACVACEPSMAQASILRHGGGGGPAAALEGRAIGVGKAGRRARAQAVAAAAGKRPAGGGGRAAAVASSRWDSARRRAGERTQGKSERPGRRVVERARVCVRAAFRAQAA